MRTYAGKFNDRLAGDFSNANFRVQIINVASCTSRDFSLDWVAVQPDHANARIEQLGD